MQSYSSWERLCNPTGVRMLVDAPLYMSRVASIWIRESPLASKLSQMIYRSMLLKFINTICRPFFLSLYFFVSLLNTCIALVVYLPGMKSNRCSLITTSCLILFSITFSHNFIVWLRSLILYNSHILVHHLCFCILGYVYCSSILREFYVSSRLHWRGWLNHWIPSSPKHLYISIRMLSIPTALARHISFRALLTSFVVMLLFDPYSCWL